VNIDYNALNELPEDGNLPDLSGIQTSSSADEETFDPKRLAMRMLTMLNRLFQSPLKS